MKLISHRGNIDGRSDRENEPARILECLELGYDVEIDVWSIDGEIFLGHDEPQYKVDLSFLRDDRLWCHAKNVNALTDMLLAGNIHCFWHQEDDYTITSRGFVWAFPGRALTEKSIAVMPERVNYTRDELSVCEGICSDNIRQYEEVFSK